MTEIIHSPVDISGVTVAVDTAGLFTPGAAFAMDAVAQVINAAWTLGNEKNADFSAKVASITAAIQAIIDDSTFDISPSTASSVSIDEPSITIPTDVTAVFDTKSADIIATLATKVTTFLTTYFPNDSTTYAKAETWLTSAIDNPNGALPLAVQAQILTDDKDRIMVEASRASDSVMASFAARGFPLPPGAAASAVLQIEQTAMDKIAESGRNIVKLSVEQMRFVIGNVLTLRDKAVSSSLEYAKVMASGQDLASRLVSAQSQLIGAVSGFYGARSDAAKVMSSVEQFNAAATQGAAEKNQISDLTLTEAKIKALMSEIQAIAQMATSLFNNVHASTGTTYSGNS